MENKYSVYMHTSPSGKRYIGITSNKPEKRWNNGRGYINNEYFSKAINKYGWDNIEHTILYRNLSKVEAEQKERELVAEYQTNLRQYGYNLTDGGDIGKKHTPESIQKMRLAKIGMYDGEKNPRFGVKVSDETKQKISIARSGKLVGENNPNFGKHLSEEQKEKIRYSKLGKHFPKLSESIKNSESCKKSIEKQKIHVDQYTKNGEFIRTWVSASDASRFLLGHRRGQSNISSCIAGKLDTAYGYIWKYHSDAMKGDVV